TAFFGIGGGIDSALNCGRNGLCLNLHRNFGGFLRDRGSRNNGTGDGRHLHTSSPLRPWYESKTGELLHGLNEDSVKLSIVYWILAKYPMGFLGKPKKDVLCQSLLAGAQP